MSDPIILDEINEAEELLRGVPVVAFEPPSPTIIRDNNGRYHTVESSGWVKLAYAMRDSMLAELRGPKISVFLCICLHVGEDGKSNPGIDTIARETGYKRRTVIESLKELEAIPGLMSIMRKRGRANVYRPAFVSYGKKSNPLVPVHPSAPVPVHAGAPVPVHAGAPEVEPIKKNQKEDLRADARAELRALDQLFTELTGLEIPSGKTDKEKRAEASAWYQPMRRMQALANGRAAEVLRAAVGQMRKDGLTISAPRSVENVFKSLYALKVSPAFVPIKVYE